MDTEELPAVLTMFAVSLFLFAQGLRMVRNPGREVERFLDSRPPEFRENQSYAEWRTSVLTMLLMGVVFVGVAGPLLLASALGGILGWVEFVRGARG